jgi:hypothetical protein
VQGGVLQTAAKSESQAESRTSAELVKGKLNPATSKPGDEIAVRLNQDVKANGEVVLKKGSMIKGVVKKVQRIENKAAAKGTTAAQSMMELEWITPTLSSAATHELNLALQSVAYTHPLYAQQQLEAQDSLGFNTSRPSSPARSSGGLVGGVGGAASSVAVVGAGVAGSTGSAVSTGILTQTASATAAPAALPVSAQTASSLQSNFGVSGNQLFHVGGGHAVSSGGTAASMDLFTHMSNDTVITSPSRDFEISSGAQMQLLIQAKHR